MRFRVALLFLFVIVMALSALPIVAQDVVEAPPPPALSTSEIVLIVVLAIVAIVLVAFGSMLVFFAKQLLNAAPPWVADVLKENANTFKELANRGILDLTKTIPGELDDRLGEIIRDEMERVFNELFPPDNPVQTDNAARFGGPPPPPVG